MRFVLAFILGLVVVGSASAQQGEAEKIQLRAELETIGLAGQKLDNELMEIQGRQETLRDTMKLLAFSQSPIDRRLLDEQVEINEQITKRLSQMIAENAEIYSRSQRITRRFEELAGK